MVDAAVGASEEGCALKTACLFDRARAVQIRKCRILSDLGVFTSLMRSGECKVKLKRHAFSIVFDIQLDAC
jgi:hypothetical protein